MSTIILIIGALIITFLIIIGSLLFFTLIKLSKNKPLEQTELEQQRIQLIEADKVRLQNEVEKVNLNLQKREGEVNEINRHAATLKAELQSELQNEREKTRNLQNKVNRFENDESRRDAEADRKLTELNNSRIALERERERVIADEKNKREIEEENRNRIWNDHEQEALRIMNESCRKPEFLFTTFENNDLPNNFDKSFKPDFMIQFLKQYIIFDAKLSKGDINSYIQNQVKKTVEKIKKSPAGSEIYKTIFFIIPSISIPEMKKLSFYEAGYRFYVIPIEAFEPIIASYKKLEDYDLADKYDPQERENVISLIAGFDHHIRRQNAVNILNTIEGINVLKDGNQLPEDISSAVEQRRSKIRLPKYKENELRRLIKDPLEQIKEIKGFIQPTQPEIKEGHLASAIDSSTAGLKKEKKSKKQVENNENPKEGELDF